MRTFVGLLLIFAALAGCEAGLELSGDLKTDLVAGEEFAVVEVIVADSQDREVGRSQRVAYFGDAYVDGRRVLALSGLEPGDYRVRMVLLDAAGRLVVSRTTAITLTESSVFTVLFSRDARACDESSCDPESTCGIGDDCIPQTCSPETADECPPVECASNEECSARSDCSVPICVSGVCLYAEQAGSCGTMQWCNPDLGCLERDFVPFTDAGPGEDAGAPADGGMDAAVEDGGAELDAGSDAGVDAGVSCMPGLADCDGDGMCEQDIEGDVRHCGGCGVRCGVAPNATATCVGRTCGLTCDPSWTDCDLDPANGCEVDLATDELHCGLCGSVCPASLPLCIARDCVAPPFLSTGADGAFAPMVDTLLAAGIHNFTTIDIPVGVTVTTDGTGVLELRATSDVTIDGVVDVSGGRGGNGGGDGTGSASGGATGTTVAGVDVIGGVCGSGGAGGAGGLGSNGVGPCGEGGRLGGGAGGGDGGGGGGGGPAGGGGSAGEANMGGAGGSFGMSRGGGASAGVGRGGEPAMGAYSGADGAAFGCCGLNGGGGGSIGGDAIGDLAMSTTFQPGSGGGGAGGSISFSARVGGGGGGGGGGALRISTPGRLVLTGDLFARGGRGGDNPATGGPAGGGGSGGAIYLVAPEMSLMGRVEAGGGAGGAGGARGGAGGLGRIRLSVVPSMCGLGVASVPPVLAGCVPTTMPERVYIGAYPN